MLGRLVSIYWLDAGCAIRIVPRSWAEAAERTRQTVRQVFGQLRRCIDYRVWPKNRRVPLQVRTRLPAGLGVGERT